METDKTSVEHSPVLEDELHLVDATASNPPVEELTDGLEKPKKHDLRPWYKRPKVWGLIVCLAIVVIGMSLGALAWRNRQVQQDFYAADWRRLTSAANRVGDEAVKANYDSFTEVERSLTDLQDRLEDSSEQLSRLPSFLVPKDNRQRYSETVAQLMVYTKEARKAAGDLEAVTSGDLDDLKSQATKTKLAVSDARNTIPGLKEDINDGFYTLNERMQTVIDAHKSLTSEEQAKANAAKSAEEQAKQNQADAEEATSAWTLAFIAGNANQMRAVMTPAFIKEYDFSQVSSNARQYNYPTTYRRVNTEKKGEQYEVLETITFVTKSDYAPDTTYTQNYIFLVSQDLTTKKWLVNSQRFGQ